MKKPALTFVKYWIFALVAAFAASSSLATPIIKSENDDRLYRTITLPNQLQVLLISDIDADKAAVSMDVAVGSAANPDSRPGLAHFLEHMLFLGTKKHPEAGEYQAFIQAHGGSHNAFTALTNTNYFFDINAADLEPAIDRFSQFFISPLFSENYTDRERHAVHSEYRAKIRDDGRRIYAANQTLINPAHPASRFAVGNLDTLPNDKSGQLRKDLLDFYAQHYSANRMKLVILGKEPLDDLQALAIRYFSAIENKALPKFEITAPQILPSNLKTKIEIQTLADIRQLALNFTTPSDHPYLQSKPLQLISSLVGYEGEGSLLALLKEKGWATGLGASPGATYKYESSFHVSISLTPSGMEHTDEIIALFFSFIESLKQTGISETLFKEEQQLGKTAFQFLAEQAPIHYVTQLAQRMQELAPAYWLNSPYVLSEYEPALYQQFLGYISPENMTLSVQAPSIQGDTKESYYNTSYRTSTIGEGLIKKWKQAPILPELHIRGNNPFIAENLAIKPAPEDKKSTPSLLNHTPDGVRSWHLQDTLYNTPKADYFFTLLTPLAREGADATVGLDLYTQMVSEELNKVLYDADMAGLSASIYPHQRGISVRVSGYNDKLGSIATLIAKTLRAPNYSPQRFARILTAYQQQLKNAEKEKPYNQLFRVGYEILLQDAPLTELQAAADSYTLKRLEALVETLFTEVELRTLSHGNLTSAEAVKINNDLITTLAPINTAAIAPALTIKQLNDTHFEKVNIDIEHNDSAVILYVQSLDDSYQARASTAVLAEILSAPFYSQLRTEEQLGYIVFASPVTLNKISGISFVVQSPNTPADMVVSRMEYFFDQFTPTLETLSDDNFEKFQTSVLNRINEQDVQLTSKTRRFWREIDQNEWKFDSREQLSSALKKLTKEDLVKQWEVLRRHKLLLSSQGRAVSGASVATPPEG